jgi:hypothetical protein
MSLFSTRTRFLPLVVGQTEKTCEVENTSVEVLNMEVLLCTNGQEELLDTFPEHKSLDDCIQCLQSLKECLPKHQTLFDNCIRELMLTEGSESSLNFDDIVSLLLLSEKYPDNARQILMCSQYVHECFSFDSECNMDVLRSYCKIIKAFESTIFWNTR